MTFVLQQNWIRSDSMKSSRRKSRVIFLFLFFWYPFLLSPPKRALLLKEDFWPPLLTQVKKIHNLHTREIVKEENKMVPEYFRSIDLLRVLRKNSDKKHHESNKEKKRKKEASIKKANAPCFTTQESVKSSRGSGRTLLLIFFERLQKFFVVSNNNDASLIWLLSTFRFLLGRVRPKKATRKQDSCFTVVAFFYVNWEYASTWVPAVNKFASARPLTK